MAIYGYARVSTIDQYLAIQEAALKAAGCTVIREEKKSGSTKQDRKERNTLLEFMRDGDSLVVTRVDRLARSVGDAGNRTAAQAKRGNAEGDGIADRHQLGGLQTVQIPQLLCSITETTRRPQM